MKRQVFILSVLVACHLPAALYARHKCATLPKARGLLASTTASTAATSIVSSRISNTSGCSRSHESDSFYKPRGAYLLNTWDYIAQEASQGSGPHLHTLAQLSGCSQQSTDYFGKRLQATYSELFGPTDKTFEGQLRGVLKHIDNLIENDPVLSNACEVNIS